MAYLGRALTSGNYLKLDDISSQFNGSLTTFNLTSGGQAFYPGSPYSILVSLAGVIQEPESAYTINESQITFASAPAASDDFFCVVLGIALGIGVPGDGTVTAAKLATGVRGVGISSAGTQIGVGITQLNFIGAGNTFAVNGTTVDISISAGAAGTWSAYTAGIATSKSVGVNTTNLDDAKLTGVGNSFQGLYVSNGMIIFDQTLNGNHYIGTNFSGLIAGPANIAGVLTIDGEYVVV